MSIRLRFTIWAAAIMLAIFFALSLGIYFMMERNLQNEMDQRVTSVYDTLRRNQNLYFDSNAGVFRQALLNPEAIRLAGPLHPGARPTLRRR